MATVLFAAPHQDDETLTLGAAINHHIRAGHDVYVLLCSAGVNSSVQPDSGLTRPQFAAARDDEYRRAARMLGVPRERILISRHSTADGDLTVQRARDSIRAFLEAVEPHADAWVKTHSDLDAQGRHADHRRLGQAARELYNESVVTNLRLYVEPYVLEDFRAAHPGVTVTEERTSTPNAVRDAIAEYRRLDEPRRFYGIGEKSVPSYLDQVEADPASYYHEP